jgi:hypothetical protein
MPSRSRGSRRAVHSDKLTLYVVFHFQGVGLDPFHSRVLYFTQCRYTLGSADYYRIRVLFEIQRLDQAQEENLGLLSSESVSHRFLTGARRGSILTPDLCRSDDLCEFASWFRLIRGYPDFRVVISALYGSAQTEPPSPAGRALTRVQGESNGQDATRPGTCVQCTYNIEVPHDHRCPSNHY